MVNPTAYQSSKIFKVASPSSEKVYLGSTLSSMTLKRSQMKKQYKDFQAGKGKVEPYFDLVKDEGFKVMLVEEFPCKSKEQLNARLDEWIDLNKETCLNIVTVKTVKLNAPPKRVTFEDESQPIDVPASYKSLYEDFSNETESEESEEESDVITVNDEEITDNEDMEMGEIPDEESDQSDAE